MVFGKRLLLLPTVAFLFLGALYAFYFLLSTTYAQETGYDVTVTPTFQDLSVNPGESVSDRVTIRNNTNSTITIAVDVKKLTGDETGQLTISEDNSDDSLSWFVFEQDTYELPPLEDVDIPFTIEVPEEAAYGYYYTINFTDTDVEEGSTGAAIAGAAAVPVLLNVRSDDAVIEGNLANFTTSAGFYEYLPVIFTTNFENTGNVHIRPKGNIFIKNWLGRDVGQLEINEGNGAILPNSSRDYESLWDDSFIVRVPKMEDGQVVRDDEGNPETELKISWDKILDLRIGKYTAEAVVVVSNSERDIAYEAQTSFFVFPWKIVGGIVIFVLFAGIGLFSTIKRFVKKIFGIFKKK